MHPAVGADAVREVIPQVVGILRHVLQRTERARPCDHHRVVDVLLHAELRAAGVVDVAGVAVDADGELVFEDAERGVIFQLRLDVGIDVGGLRRRRDGQGAVAGAHVVFRHLAEDAQAIDVGIAALHQGRPAVVDLVAAAEQDVLAHGGVLRPQAGAQQGRIVTVQAGQRDDAVHRLGQGQNRLLHHILVEDLVVELEAQPRRRIPVHGQGAESLGAAGILDERLHMAAGRVEANPELPVVAETAADVDGADSLAVRGAGRRDRFVRLRCRPLHDQADDAAGAGDAVQQGVGAFQYFHPLLVLRQADDVDRGEAAIQPIARGRQEMDAADVKIVRKRARLRVRGFDAGDVAQGVVTVGGSGIELGVLDHVLGGDAPEVAGVRGFRRLGRRGRGRRSLRRGGMSRGIGAFLRDGDLRHGRTAGEDSGCQQRPDFHDSPRIFVFSARRFNDGRADASVTAPP